MSLHPDFTHELPKSISRWKTRTWGHSFVNQKNQPLTAKLFLTCTGGLAEALYTFYTSKSAIPKPKTIKPTHWNFSSSSKLASNPTTPPPPPLLHPLTPSPPTPPRELSPFQKNLPPPPPPPPLSFIKPLFSPSKPKPETSSHTHTAKMPFIMHIRVDGGCRNNGHPSATAAAAAVFYNRNGFPTTFTKRLLYHPQLPTSQRAELTAIILALEHALVKYSGLRRNPRLKVTIYTDSKYAHGCMTGWGRKWVRNGRLI